MWVALAVTLSVTLAAWAVIKRIRHRNLRLPPGPRGWPLVGNLLQVGEFPHRHFAKLCERYGPLVYLRLGNVRAITTNDPEVIREILVTQDHVFSSRPVTAASAHLAYKSGDVAFAPMGPKWKHMRRICMEHLLTTRRLDSFANHRRQESDLLVNSVSECSGRGKSVDLREVLGAFSMNNVTRMMLGKRYFGASTAGPEEAAEFMKIMHELFWLLGVIYVGDYFPWWRWVDFSRLEKRMMDVGKRQDEFHNMILHEHRLHREMRRGREGKDEEEEDFVDVLLSLPGDNGKERLDDVDIKAIVQDMIAAATDTSSVMNEWAMAEMIKNQRVLRKAQEEVDLVVGKERMVEEADLVNLKYLRCVVRETFRMHPAGPFLILHESLTDTKMMGYDIPAGTRVFINTYGLGRNTKLWDNIDQFRPERHMPESKEERVEISHGGDFRILPFSAGKRKCPGAPLGTCFMLFALARLVHCFDWEAPPQASMTMEEVYGMTMPRCEPLFAFAKPRLPPHLYP